MKLILPLFLYIFLVSAQNMNSSLSDAKEVENLNSSAEFEFPDIGTFPPLGTLGTLGTFSPKHFDDHGFVTFFWIIFALLPIFIILCKCFESQELSHKQQNTGKSSPKMTIDETNVSKQTKSGQT